MAIQLKTPSGVVISLDRCDPDTDKHFGSWARAEDMGSRSCQTFYAAPCGCVASTYESVPAGYGQQTQFRGPDWEKVCPTHAGAGTTVVIDGKKYLDLRKPGDNWPLRADSMLEIAGEVA
jgi:hypothetical protein